MAYHERNPWREPQRRSRSNSRILIGCLIAVAAFIVLAVIEIQAALIIVGLAVVTGLVLFIGSKVGRRR
jgi:uncharacterized membrane protein YccC